DPAGQRGHEIHEDSERSDSAANVLDHDELAIGLQHATKFAQAHHGLWHRAKSECCRDGVKTRIRKFEVADIHLAQLDCSRICGGLPSGALKHFRNEISGDDAHV